MTTTKKTAAKKKTPKKAAAKSKTASRKTVVKKTPGRKTPSKKTQNHKTAAKKWSGKVTRESDALTLEDHVFTRSAIAIAQSLKRSAERSTRRKSSPYQSAMSMLTFYENRGGKNFSAAQKKKLEAAKTALRRVFGRD